MLHSLSLGLMVPVGDLELADGHVDGLLGTKI